MGDQYIGEIQAFGFPWATSGFNQAWLPCQGQLLPLQQFTPLFALIGTYYGGNGTTNFALPNMVGMVSNSQGNGPGLQPRLIGETLGSPTVTLTTQQMAAHIHGMQMGAPGATGAAPGPGTASNMAAIDPGFNGFAPPPTTTTLSQNAMSLTGSSQAHDNNQPTQAIVWCIAYAGIFPSFSQS